MSTDSGIPDYRGPDSPPSNPMTIRQFTSDPVFRQRYWARNHVGWRHMNDTQPNAGHRAVATLERNGFNIKQSAKEMGISRVPLYRNIEKHGIPTGRSAINPFM